MTIQRQYTLPNCNLVLEGMGANGDDPLAPLTVLMNVECHLPGAAEKPLSGGRVFLEQLVAAVSRYAQRLLSGVMTPAPSESPAIELKPGEGDYHHLLVRSQLTSEAKDTNLSDVTPMDIKLTTVQFFDLLDAIDQLMADPQTLPDMTLRLQPVSRRFVKPTEPVAKRVAPAAIGSSALAAAAAALFFVPLPKFEPQPNGADNSTADVPESVATPSPTAAPDPTASPTATPTDTPTDASATTDAQAGADALEQLAAAPAITDPVTLGELQSSIASKLQAAWQPDSLPENDLSYRIAVSKAGDILGYKYLNDDALANVDSTPLPSLTYAPVDAAAPVQEPVAQLVANFTPGGSVTVEPWKSDGDASSANGSSDTTSDNASSDTSSTSRPMGDQLEAIANPVDDREQVIELRQTLRAEIADRWDTAELPAALTYRVRLNQAGDIVGYQGETSAATAAIAETPLPDLPAAADATGAMVDFKVVFTEDGVIEVSPWDGLPD